MPRATNDVREAVTGDRKITLAALPSAEAEQERLGRTFKLADFQPTGWYVPAGKPVTVTVERPQGAPEPELVVGTPALGGSEAEVRTYKLNKSSTTVTDPKGGSLQIRYTTPPSQASAPKITVSLGEGAERIPLYVPGRTTPEQWRQQLDAAKDAPVAQLLSRHTVVNTSVASARKYAAEDVAGLLATYDKIVEAEDGFSGQPGRGGPDRVSPLLYYIAEGKTGENPDATDFRVHWPADLMEEALTTKGLRASWGMWHELGHLHQQAAWDWEQTAEVTVNLYSLAVERAFKTDPRLTKEHAFEAARPFLARPDSDRVYNKLDDPWTMLAMFEQLRLAFGDDLYAKLHQATRKDRPQPADDPERMRYFMTAASKAAGADLTAFFTRWGLQPDNSTRTAIADLGLPQPDKDPAALSY
ncbi:M60 family metallopeptidase [Streptomyces sp. NPDC050485]|uniref:M60 family metallopeptidase n=1 Tax=Streptomyces sp. NPDC050485 TaxID=3365617 RepID=UPI0037A60EFC